MFFLPIHKNHRKSSKIIFFSSFPTWLKTFADARDGDGDGDGGTIGPFCEHFRTILGPYANTTCFSNKNKLP